MTTTTAAAHSTNIYVGPAGESALIVGAEGTPLGEGGIYRLTEGQPEWASIDHGLPENPQVRALLGHPDRPPPSLPAPRTASIAATTGATTGAAPIPSPAKCGPWPPTPTTPM